MAFQNRSPSLKNNDENVYPKADLNLNKALKYSLKVPV